MANKKISQLTAKGTALAATDLVEISEDAGGGNYVTKSVTGANIKSGLQATLVSGTNIKTINSNSLLGSGDLIVGGGGTEIGALIGGGVVVGVFNINGVNKALVASLTNLSNALPYTIPAFQSTTIGATAQSYSDGLTNTNAIIAQTLLPATTAYAAGIARLFAGGGFSDWYLPSLWELNICYNSAIVTGKVTGVTSFNIGNYWSSTEETSTTARKLLTGDGSVTGFVKSANTNVRAVRIHTI
jgi:hypothetical protein